MNVTTEQLRGLSNAKVVTDHGDKVGTAGQFYLDDESALTYPASVRAVTDCTVLALPAKEFARAFASWFPMAVHLLEGMLMGLRRNNSQVAERERLLALGKLSAGLTHELNNPAAAAGRAADALEGLPDGPALDALRDSIAYAVERQR